MLHQDSSLLIELPNFEDPEPEPTHAHTLALRCVMVMAQVSSMELAGIATLRGNRARD